MHWHLFLSALLFSRCARTQIATAVNHAIVPTKSGQIGINPVTEDIGPASQYVAPIGTDTGRLSLDGSTTKVRPP
jgi:hypothetical protein